MQGFGPQGIEFDTPALTLINYDFIEQGWATSVLRSRH